MSIRPIWLRLTAEVNAIDYLERATCFIRETEKNQFAWKWVVLALHSALYSFAICACRGTSNVNLMEKNDESWLIGFDEALKRCQDPKCMRALGGGRCLTLTDSQRESIRFFKNELRNNMEHYVPRGWSIEIHGMPQKTIDALDVIRFLAVDTHTYIQGRLNPAQLRKIKSCVFQSKKLLRNTKLYQDIENGKAPNSREAKTEGQ